MKYFFNKKTWFISSFIILFAIVISAALVYKEIKLVAADNTDNVSGYAWSSNIGWISFNCTDDDSCASANYGVNIDDNYNFLLANGNPGYAWSSNIGWIRFGGSDTPPDNYAFNSNCSNTCNASNSCTACYNSTDNNVYGWAKILSLGNDGWLKLNSEGEYSCGSADIVFEENYGGAGADKAQEVILTSDGGYITVGYSYSFGGNGDVYVVKSDSDGNIEWTKTYGNADTNRGLGIDEISTGGYIISRYEDCFALGCMVLTKINSTGVEQWSRSYGSGNPWTDGEDVHETSDNGFISCGYQGALKTNSNGIQQWQINIGGYCSSIQQTSDGKYILTGKTFTGNDVFLAKVRQTSPNSAIIEQSWTFIHPTAARSLGQTVLQTSDGGYIIWAEIGSNTSINDNYDQDIWIIKTNSSGVKEWDKTYGGASQEGFTDFNNISSGEKIQQTSDGGYIFTGYTRSYGAGGQDIWLVKIDASGNEEWSTTFGGTGNEDGTSVRQTSDGGYIISAISSFPVASLQYYLIKTNETGSSTEETCEYGVSIDPVSGEFSGWAWNSNIYDEVINLEAEITDGEAGFSLLNGAYHLYVANNYAYIVSLQDNSLTIADISDKSNPVLVKEIKNNDRDINNRTYNLNNPVSVFIKDNYAYITSTQDFGNKGNLTILNISDPYNPFISSEVSQDGTFTRFIAPTDVFVDGDYAYVTCLGSDSFNIINISNKTSPTLMSVVYDGSGGFTRLDEPKAVVTQGNYAYVVSNNYNEVAGAGNSLAIIDISNKSNPTLVKEVWDNDGTYSRLDWACSVAVSGDYAYVIAGQDDALTIINISDPANPQLVNEIVDGQNGYNYLDGARNVFVSNNYAYVASQLDNSLTKIDVTDPYNPELMFESYTGDGTFSELDGASDVFVYNNHALVASYVSDSLTIAETSYGEPKENGVGWVSFNCTDTGTCASSDYKVLYQPFFVAAPTNLVASAQSCSTVLLTWEDNASNETGYETQWSVDGVSGWTSHSPDLNPDIISRVVIQNPSSTLYYQVRALGEVLNSDWEPLSNGVAGTTSYCPPVLTLVSGNCQRIRLSWSQVGTGVDHYEIWRSINGAAYNLLIDNILPGTTTYNDENITPGTNYAYYLKAQTDDLDSNIVSDTPCPNLPAWKEVKPR
ncbi:MAG: hypothetical protein ABIG60_00825 [Patescibacteria group bacterium]